MSIRELEKEEDALRSEVTKLDPNHRKFYYELESKRIKDPDTYAALNYTIVGGLHHFYLGKLFFGALNFALTVIGVVTFLQGGWILIVLVIVIELPQLFRAQSIVKKYNNQIMSDTLDATKKHFALY